MQKRARYVPFFLSFQQCCLIDRHPIASLIAIQNDDRLFCKFECIICVFLAENNFLIPFIGVRKLFVFIRSLPPPQTAGRCSLFGYKYNIST